MQPGSGYQKRACNALNGMFQGASLFALYADVRMVLLNCNCGL